MQKKFMINLTLFLLVFGVMDLRAEGLDFSKSPAMSSTGFGSGLVKTGNLKENSANPGFAVDFVIGKFIRKAPNHGLVLDFFFELEGKGNKSLYPSYFESGKKSWAKFILGIGYIYRRAVWEENFISYTFVPGIGTQSIREDKKSLSGNNSFVIHQKFGIHHQLTSGSNSSSFIGLSIFHTWDTNSELNGVKTDGHTFGVILSFPVYLYSYCNR